MKKENNPIFSLKNELQVLMTRKVDCDNVNKIIKI